MICGIVGIWYAAVLYGTFGEATLLSLLRRAGGATSSLPEWGGSRSVATETDGEGAVVT
ncbi:MAG: hypothetical protein IJR99_07300 [Kiritimatiellae bacterium]|nr:hypothetical protein [Kiritimatiellia bacterium]